ncbi:hypothetical protein JXA32_04610 [Candidatus Sumerlaeota bacterium]|nr:hypothetical protein [Candidatus Sumerlaeota bacterium]
MSETNENRLTSERRTPWSVVRPGYEWIYDYTFHWDEATDHSAVVKNDPERSSIIRIEHQGRSYYAKRYPVPWRRVPGYLLISSKAWREWRVLERCEKTGILAPLPLAFGRQYGLRENMACLVMSCVKGVPLKMKVKGRPWDDPELLRIMRRAGEAAQSLHALGFWHADLKLLHIIEQDDGRLGLIDLDGSKFFLRFFSKMRRARNLFQLYRNLAEHQLSQEAEDELARGYLDAGGAPAAVKLFRRQAANLRVELKDAILAQRAKNLAEAQQRRETQ